MTALLLFASTFALVFFLGLQSLNVNRGHTVAAFFTSFGIGLGTLNQFRARAVRQRHRDRRLPLRRPARNRLVDGLPSALLQPSQGDIMQQALNPAAGWPAPISEPAEETPLPAIGTPYQGGFFAGLINVAGQRHALIVAPKATGEHDDTIWIHDYQAVPGAKSYDDGLANTLAMAEAGSELAKWARGLDIGGFTDWYLPAQDELELCYRNLKPTTRENYCYARSGINLSAVPPTRPYTTEFPLQTSAAVFQQGGAEAFADEWYWSSTQHASASDYAWSQTFFYGGQDGNYPNSQFRARAVRRSTI